MHVLTYLVLLLERVSEVLHQSLVEVAPTKMAIIRSGDDFELALSELADGAGVVAVANIHKRRPPWLLVRARQVELGDAVAKRSRSGLVDQPQDFDAGNLRRVQNHPPLRIGIPRRDRNDHVADGQLQLRRSRLLHPRQEHGTQLHRGELLLLAHVADFGAHGAVDVDQRRRDILLLYLDIRVRYRAAAESRERADGVLQVRDLLRLRRLAEIPALGSESNEGRCGSVGDFVGDDVDALVPRNRNDRILRAEIYGESQ